MKKLLVFMIDALCSSDIEYMKTLPHFKEVFERGSYVEHIYPCHPALTYCAHTTIVTGCYVDRHGITNNERLVRGCKSSDVWYGKKEEVRVPTFLDKARQLGLTTCSLSWPVSAHADYTYNWPMYVPYNYKGYDPMQWLKDGNATENLLEAYYWKYSRYIKGPDSSLDLLTMSIAPDLIRDFSQPDIMLVKMCDLDSVRHRYGVYAEETKVQLRKHDEEFGVLLESLKRYGDYENTNIVIMGDHGQTDIVEKLNFNKLLADKGFIRLDAEGNMIDCDCFAHTAALSCFIELKDPSDSATEKKVRDFLESLKDDPEIALDYVCDKKEMKERFHLEGPFDFVIESKRNIAFSDRLNVTSIWGSKEPGSHTVGAATHGSNPYRAENTTFIACGPSVREGVVIKEAEMVDEAVTMAKMVGFDFENTDGKLLRDLLI